VNAPDYEFAPPRARCGVYHLVRDGVVVYVGASRNLLGRIGGHEHQAVDTVRFFFCAEADLDVTELEHIVALRPPLNTEGVTRPFLGGLSRKRTLYAPLPASAHAKAATPSREPRGNERQVAEVSA